MLINGIELSSLGVKLYDRVITSNRVKTQEEWLEGDIQPTYIRQQDSFKNIDLTFLVLCQEEEDAFFRISKLTQMLKKSILQFDDMSYMFDVKMTGVAEPTRLKNGNFLVEYSFTADYAMGEREIYTTNANLTNSSKITILYYQDGTTLLGTDSLTIRASAFKETGTTLADIGINVDKYQPNYYQTGVATNLNNKAITYENLRILNTLIINYAPMEYNLTVQYMRNMGDGVYEDLITVNTKFTYPGIKNARSIGQIINLQTYRPNGYRASINYDGPLTVEGLLAASPIYVFYDEIEQEQSKSVTVSYYQENDSGTFTFIQANVVVFVEGQFSDGLTLRDILNVNAEKPNQYYNNGYIVDHNLSDFVTYDSLEVSYQIRYPKITNTIYVEYYAGTYPNWYRLSTVTLPTKYKESYEESFDLEDIGLDVDLYHTNVYASGVVYNGENIQSYEDVINTGVIQVYYVPIEYTLRVIFSSVDQEEEPEEEQITITALDFFSNPVLNDIIPILENKPEGYRFSPELSYQGEVTLTALLQNAPISIVYEEIAAEQTKNIIIRYKREFSSAFGTINTSLITINESDTVGGVRLNELFNLNAYKPDYYENGIIDGASSTALVEFDQIQSSYDVLYLASTYLTSVRYYINEVSDLTWIGSSSISYRVIDFEADTTLYDLGLNVNLYKPSTASNGEIQYSGAINFASLRELPSINITYAQAQQPDDEGIDYPHRFLFLQHNDLGDFEYLHPEWTLNHAYINTGISVDDMTKLTVIMECARVDNNAPLDTVNAGYGYLFGSSSPLGSYFMRFNNQTQYGNNLSGVNTYEAKAGLHTNTLVLTEANAVGFSENSGIYALERPGYSTATFTYSNTMQSEAVQMPYPLYLFACNNAGSYSGGLAGIGIYSCRIYYNGQLIRDMIPVQFYDKIGDQTAPSNCLYDKITKTFFEDATGQNSFNIIDDERYEDDNPEHKIGSCFVTYYKDDIPFNTASYYFRASDFTEDFDPYELFMVEEYQPAYFRAGEIQNYNQITWDFEHMKGQSFVVVYEEMANQITVNYYKEVEGTNVLITTETLGISERDFLQAPTFGQLVRINKYKPEGYETDFEYQGTKVTLARVVEAAPYDIVYKPIEGEVETYTTIIRYIKKVYGLRTYETLGTETLTFDQSHFRDGEFIDFFIDFNEMKPQQYYEDGAPYQWYLMDEMIDTPEKLKEMYTVVYAPSTMSLDVNYYVGEISESTQVATTSWTFKIDDFEPGYDIYIVDILPNEYINKFKPLNCNGGQLQDTEIGYDFDELVALEEIAIVYPVREQPHDPENAEYERKVLYWGEVNSMEYTDEAIFGRTFTGGKIPWIDLGYKPKEIGRLRAEVTGYARPYGLQTPTTGYGYQGMDYLYYFGYYGPLSAYYLGQEKALEAAIMNSGGGMSSSLYTNFSPGSSGAFAIRCRCPQASGWVYTAEGPQSVDGQVFYRAGSDINQFRPIELKNTGIYAGYRKGYFMDLDDELEPFVVNNNYTFWRTDSEDYYKSAEYTLNKPSYSDDMSQFRPSVCWNRAQVYESRQTVEEGEEPIDFEVMATACGNPYTVILDAYNKVGAVWRYGDSNTPITYVFDESDDAQLFEDICQPVGSISLFQTTNPSTGEINVMPFDAVVYPYLGLSGSLALSGKAIGNPYSGDFDASVSIEVWTSTEVQGGQLGDTGTANPGTATGTQGSNTGQAQGATVGTGAVVKKQIVNRSIQFADFSLNAFPQMTGCAIWSIKLYDRNRLVRNLIPVAAGDRIYDYVMPANGLFDLVTEIFFGNGNQGGSYEFEGTIARMVEGRMTATVRPEQVYPLQVALDPLIYGYTITNYYDYDNSFIYNKYVEVPVWYNYQNESIENILAFNDFKPDDYHLDGFLDLDQDLSIEDLSLRDIYEMGANNVYYKLRTFTKTVVYYQDNVRIGSRDLFYSLADIENATDLEDLGIEVDLFYDPNFKHGRIVFDESIIASDDIQAFIDAPSPIVVYDKLTKYENPDIFYVEYYRGGASDDSLITIDSENPNYLDCNLSGVILNPHGAIKYYNHYHTALYEDEDYDYFIPYQVRVTNRFTGIHRGPARRYQTLAMIVERDTYTIIEERNGWGRLKEYPIGWILLNQTEPMTGPGQNPDYDIADQETATIPFGEEVQITKLTIDRLWCYVPEVESWIKAEDVSYNQAGKLYNGLAIEVIDLSQVNFTGAQDLTDIGIDIDKYNLYYHELSDYECHTAYFYEDFSDLHEIDIVYQEKIYNYNCVYYEYYPNGENELGRSAFSCSISDWNPDWDTFLATSYDTEEVVLYGVFRAPQVQEHTYFSIYDEPGGEVKFTVPGQTLMWITGEDEYNSIYHYWPVMTEDRRTGWARGNDANVLTEYGGTVTQRKTPTLYRDTELTLSWDYFGFDRNLYKPVGCGDGIYLWNPRSWDKDNIQFTFNELIRCGTQYVVYPPFNVDTYKIWIKKLNDAGEVNQGIVLDLHEDVGVYDFSIANPERIVDVYVASEIKQMVDQHIYGNSLTKIEYQSQAWGQKIGITTSGGTTSAKFVGESIPLIELNGFSNNPNIPQLKEGDKFIWSLSNTNTRPHIMIGIGNDITNEEDKYYIITEQGYWDTFEVERFYPETNLKGRPLFYRNRPKYRYRLDTSTTTDTYTDVMPNTFGVIYDVVTYENSMMTHYYVPVPQGLKYYYDGAWERMAANGLFDLLTGELATSYKLVNGVKADIDGAGLIYLRNQTIDDEPYSYFSDWEFDTTDCNYWVNITNNNTDSFEVPDLYAPRVRTLQSIRTLATKYTSDSAHGIEGEWYLICDQWVPTSDCSIQSAPYSEFYDYVVEKKTLALIPKEGYSDFRIFAISGLMPTWAGVQQNDGVGTFGTDPILVTTYVTWKRKGEDTVLGYLCGEGWITKEYTQENYTVVNLNYVISQDTIYYRYPIEDIRYRISTYPAGDRITVLRQSNNDETWLYTGQGWIRNKGTNLSLIE